MIWRVRKFEGFGYKNINFFRCNSSQNRKHRWNEAISYLLIGKKKTKRSLRQKFISICLSTYFHTSNFSKFATTMGSENVCPVTNTHTKLYFAAGKCSIFSFSTFLVKLRKIRFSCNLHCAFIGVK